MERNQTCETRYVEQKQGLTWKVRGFLTLCPCGPNEYLKSPLFRVDSSERCWHLQLYPVGFDNTQILTVLLMSNVSRRVYIKCSLSLVGTSGSSVHEQTFSQWFSGKSHSVGVVNRSELLQQRLTLLPDDVLTLCCKVSVVREMQSIGACVSSGDRLHHRGSLQHDLGKFFDLKKHDDVLLKVGDQHIAAHKAVLVSRSRVFASMFDIDMVEKATSEVDLVDVGFDVLVELLRFMYSDEADFRDVGFCLQLLAASDKFDVPLLKSRCAQYLDDGIAADNVFEILIAANTYNEVELRRSCMGFVRYEMSSVTNVAEWVAKMKFYPQALDIIEEFMDVKSE